MEYAENAFEAAIEVEDADLAAQTAGGLYATYAITGEFSRIVETAPKVLDLLEKARRESASIGGINMYSQLLAYYGFAMGWLGNFEEAEALFEKGLRFAREIDDLFGLTVIEMQYGFISNVKGDGREAIAHLQNSIRYCEEAQLVVFAGYLRSVLGWGHYLLGELETARKQAEAALEMGSEAMPFQQVHVLWVLGMVHFELGDLMSAQRWMEEVLKSSQELAQRQGEAWIWTWLGRIVGKADPLQSHTAEEYMLHGIKMLQERKLKPVCFRGYLYLGELYADMGQREKALDTLKKAEGAFQEMGMDYWLRRTQEVLKRVQG